MTEFKPFSKLIKAKFDEMSKGELYVTDISGDDLFEAYLNAYPEGTNPLFRERTEHDCSCCKNFIRNIGNVVAIVDGKMTTVWDIVGAEAEYGIVAAEMNATIHEYGKIKSVFRCKETGYGAESTKEILADGKGSVNWNHFYATIAGKHLDQDAAATRGRFDSAYQVFRRGLEELTPSSISSILDLIDNDSLYRGAEFRPSVKAFSDLQKEYVKLNSEEARDLFAWANVGSVAAGFRNTVIGSLAQDISAGDDLEGAVRAFESKVAPTNYKRPKALITPRMISDAVNTIAELGLETALERRFAVVSDVSVNNVLFVDNSVRGKMKGGIESLLMTQAVTKTPDVKSAEDISIDNFLANIVPQANSIDVLLKNSMLGNFMSLTAPVNESVERLFKWDNNFAWSYDGNITDSLRQRVSDAGGRIDGALRFSHTWNYDGKNQSLMDLHVFMPGYKNTSINTVNDTYPSSRRVGWNMRNDYASGGVQDVDFVNPPGTAVPVENITFPSLDKMPEGVYTLKIHNWAFRPTTTSGFRAEIEFEGQIFEYEYPKALKNKEWVTLAEVTLKNKKFTIDHKLPSSSTSKEKWGVKTETLVPVDTIILSPNHWDEQNIGNKHWFFILKDCVNPEPTRGIYNEFLKPELEKHRKVFEILGDKTKCVPSDDQLSGVGFSSTKRENLIVSVKGNKLQKVYNIKF